LTHAIRLMKKSSIFKISRAGGVGVFNDCAGRGARALRKPGGKYWRNKSDWVGSADISFT
jgi:hypothetical protein